MGSLIVVGTGIKPIAQTSAEAVSYIESSDRVFFIVADALSHYWIEKLNPKAESLIEYYQPGKDRLTTYNEIVEHVLRAVREGFSVCFAVYGHPGVFAYPTHESVRQARAEGYHAEMLPSVSAEDCLFADLGVDPGDGCQSYEATDFLVRKRRIETRAALILWQIGLVAQPRHKNEFGLWNPAGLDILIETLLKHYDRHHEVTVYEAARYASCNPMIQRVELGRLGESKIGAISTLYVPPKKSAPIDKVMARRLGLI